MTTLAIPARTYRLQLPLGLGRRRARLVLSLAVQTQRKLGRRVAAADAATATDRASATAAQRRADDLRTAALAQRLPGF